MNFVELKLLVVSAFSYFFRVAIAVDSIVALKIHRVVIEFAEFDENSELLHLKAKDGKQVNRLMKLLVLSAIADFELIRAMSAPCLLVDLNSKFEDFRLNFD